MHSIHLFRRTIIVSAISLFSAGCAQLPSWTQLNTQDSFKPKETPVYAASSVKNNNAAWPIIEWWKNYNDPQLQQLINEGLQGSPDIQIVQARFSKASSLVQQSQSVLSPSVSTNTSLSEEQLSSNYLTPPAATPQGWKDFGRSTLDLRWDLDFWGRNKAALKASQAEQRVAQAEVAQAKLMLAANIALAYVELKRLHTNKDILLQALDVRKKMTLAYTKRFEKGVDSKIPMEQAKTQQAWAESSIFQIDEQIGLQRNRLAALVGAGPDRGQKITAPTLNTPFVYGVPANLALDLLGHRPDIQAAKLRVQAQYNRIDQKRAEFYPNVNLNGMFGAQAMGIDRLTMDNSSIGSFGISISLPLFTAGRLQGELRSSMAAHDEAVANYNKTIVQALNEVADAALSLRQLAPRLEKGQEAIASAKRAYMVNSKTL